MSFELLYNATLYKSEPKSWFNYFVDTEALYYIPYRGVIVTLWNGLVASVQWEDVSKKFSLCPQEVGQDLDMCPVLCNSTTFEGCDLKVGF